MERRVFNEEHELFRQQFKKFCEREVTPNVERWEEQRIVDRETWKKAGEQGFLCPTLDPKYGGSGVDFGYSAIINEEVVRAGSSGFHGRAPQRHRRALHRGLRNRGPA